MPKVDPRVVQAYCKLTCLAQTTDDLTPVAFGSPWVKPLWEVIRAVVSHMLRRLEATQGLVAELTDAPPEVSERAAQLAQDFARQEELLVPLLGLVESSEAVRVPYVMIEPLKRLAETATEQDVSLALTYQWIPSNYAIRPDVAERLRRLVDLVFPDDSGNAKPTVPHVLALASVPAGHGGSVLEHSILFHEVGHLTTRERIDPCYEQYLKLGDQELNELTKLVLGETPYEIEHGTIQWGIAWQQVRKRALRVLGRWLWECLSDLWATCVAGPALMLASLHLGRVDLATDTHPPTRTRYKLMAAALDQLGFLDDRIPEVAWVRHITETLVSHVAAAPGTSAVDEDALQGALADRLEQSIPQLVAWFIHTNSIPAYTAETWAGRYVEDPETGAWIHPHVLCLLNYTPPGAVGGVHSQDGAALAHIVNAGWNVLVDPDRWTDFRGGLGIDGLAGEREARERLNRLLLKAIDIHHLEVSLGE